MKNKLSLKNLFAILMTFVVLISSTTAVYAENLLADKTLISGYEEGTEYTKIRCRFKSLTKNAVGDIEIEYGDGFFERDPDIYYHDLARASFGMTVSAFRGGVEEGQPQDKNIQEFYQEAGFVNYESAGFDQEPTGTSISTAMASKKIGDTTVIAFVCCGQGYGMEWLSNLTVGSGVEHQGFSDSAYICEERLTEYVDKHNITGDVKLWISGFSRASAVGNMLAGRMMEKDIFSDIYAYFYATPNNTTEPVAYPNIFNIIGQNDPVPMVPLSEWGYGRNGVDLYTPAQESNSSYIYSVLIADDVSTELTGSSFRNNPEANRQLRVLFEYLAAIFPTSADYVATLQPQLLQVWAKHSGSDILTVLREALKNIEGFDIDRQQAVDSLIDYLDEVIYKYISGNEIQVSDGSWDTSAGVGVNVVLEHVPEVYAVWMFSFDDPNELFAASTESIRLVIEGDFNLTVRDEAGIVQEISNTNEESAYIPGSDERSETADWIYLYTSNNNGKAVINIPTDKAYSIELSFLEKNTVTMFGVKYSYGKATEETSEIQVFSAQKGDTVVINGFNETDGIQVYTGNGEKVPTLKQSISSDPKTLIVREQLMAKSFTLRQIIILFIVLAALPILLLIASLVIFLAGRKKKKGKTAVTVCFMSISGIWAAGAVVFSIMLPNLKLIISAFALLSALIAAINILRYKKLIYFIVSVILMAAAFINYFVLFNKNRIIIHGAIMAVLFAAGLILAVILIKTKDASRR